MADMNVFTGDAFSAFEMSTALDLMPFAPNWLGSLNIFDENPIRTTDVAIEKRNNTLRLVPTSERGAPVPQRTQDPRDIRIFRTPRVANGDRLNASEIQNIRAFGQESELEQVADETMRRMTKLRADNDLTQENMRLGAVQGIVYDADGTTVLRNWFTEWGVTQPAEVDFNLDGQINGVADGGGSIRTACNNVIRAMQRASGGAWIPGVSYAVGLASDSFFDGLVANKETRETFLNQQEAADLRTGTAFQTFKYGGVNFVNYQGTDDSTKVAIATDKVKFFPVATRGVFQVARSPGESFDLVNNIVNENKFFAMTVPDKDRNMFVDLEVYSYPLYVCTRPLMLQRGKLT